MATILVDLLPRPGGCDKCPPVWYNNGVTHRKESNTVKNRRYEIDGRVLEIPLIYDEVQDIWLEDYSEIIDTPQRTPLGYPIIICADDACRFAAPGIQDCGSCPHYAPAGEHTWFGSCRNHLRQEPIQSNN